MSTSAERNARHKRAMQRKKEHIDGNIAKATINKGLMVVLTGNGKGKSSSAFGMLARSVGHGLRCGVSSLSKARGTAASRSCFSTISWLISSSWPPASPETQDRKRILQRPSRPGSMPLPCCVTLRSMS